MSQSMLPDVFTLYRGSRPKIRVTSPEHLLVTYTGSSFDPTFYLAKSPPNPEQGRRSDTLPSLNVRHSPNAHLSIAGRSILARVPRSAERITLDRFSTSRGPDALEQAGHVSVSRLPDRSLSVTMLDADAENLMARGTT